MSQIVTMPQLGETVTEGTILRWLVKIGDEVKEDDPILEISTDKVDTEVPSPFSGKVTSLLVDEGQTVEVGASLLELDGTETSDKNIPEEKITEAIESEVTSTKVDESNLTPKANQKTTDIQQIETMLSPVVRRLARENNIDLKLVTGTGPVGRITRKDIKNYIESESKPKSVDTSSIEKVRTPSVEKSNAPQDGTSNEISRLRKRIAENMIMSKQTSAHVMTSVEVDYENVEITRRKNKEVFKNENGFSLTYLPFIALSTIHALREFPTINSSFDLEKGIHQLHNDINLGIAVDLNQKGLLVGNLREADSYNLKGISRKIFEVSNLLRDGKYGLGDVTGSTFTISNNGSFNSFITSPIINQPNVAILSTESVKKRPVVIESADGTDSIAIRHTGILSLTWDHRVFDGSVALLFLNSIKNKLEKTDWSQEIT